MTSRPVSVTSPITAARTSHLAQTSRNCSTRPGSTTAIMRSCDSLIKISGGPRDASRSGTASSRTCIPPVPAAASSVVAQATPAAPRSWMPTTRPPAYSSRQHSTSSFSRKGSPTWTLGRFAASPRRNTAERRAGQHRGPADAVGSGGGPEQDHLVPRPASRRDLQVAVPHHAHAERVDQRVSRVARVEVQLPADVGQAEAVPVEGDAADHAGQHPARVGGRGGPEPERVHHRHRARAHGEDVADDPADAGRRALIRLHVGRVVMRLDLEGDRVALADVDHARVVPDAREQRAGRRRLRRELPQVHLGGLVGAVLAPHDRVQGQLGAGRAAAEGLRDLGVLGLGQAELGKWLRLSRRRRPPAPPCPSPVTSCTPAATTEAKKPRPSAEGPVS